MKIPFVGPSYQARSIDANAQRAVNCYLELDRTSSNAPIAMYGTPGLTLRATLSGEIRGVITQGSLLYVVAGNTVYKVDSSWTATSLGTIGTATGLVGVASNGTQVLIVDGTDGWIATSTALTKIVDSDFPRTVTSCTFQDGYFLVAGDGTGKFYINETPNAGTNWNGLDFATAEGNPDNTVAIVSDHREVWLIGSKSAEIWVNTGDTDFPFQRSGNAFIENGTIAARSVAKMDNSIFWLGANDYGQGVMFRAQGYQPARVSNHAIETAWAGYSTLADAHAWCYQLDGHSFYVLTFPTANHTWVFDASTGEWHEWLWRNPNVNTLHRHRANCGAFFNGKHVVGDWENGKLYTLERDVYTDNGDPILRMRTTQTLEDEGVRLFFEELNIHMETGVGLAVGQGSNPQVMLRYFNDGGHVPSNVKTSSIGAAGRYGRRVLFGPTGAARRRVWELSMTDPVKFALYGASARVRRGTA